MADLTREAVDWVFTCSDVTRFGQPERIKKLCEMRLQGITYAEIAKKLNINATYASNCVQKVARAYERFLKGYYNRNGDFTDKEINYIKAKYTNTPVEDIARKLRRSVMLVENQISEMLAQGVIANYSRKLNPNPITNTTKMLVCRYYKDNLQRGMEEKAAKCNIASELSRTYDTICSILEECKADGMYEVYNQYGT